MTIRNILVPTAERPECALALDKACGLAVKLGANLTGCHITPHPGADNRLARSKAKAAKALFEKFAQNHNLPMVARPRGGNEASAHWVEMPGTPEHVMPIVGRTADLIMVSRPRAAGSRLAHAFLSESVISTGRPVLVVPQRRHFRITGHMAVAWDRSSEAARAVKLALPLMKLAGDVTFFEVSGDLQHGPTARDMVGYLAWHGVKARAKVLKGAGVPEHQLITAINDSNAHMVIMGAYSHSRLREVIFGGVTRFMLYEARLPVFVVH